jgi:hypothetical protein
LMKIFRHEASGDKTLCRSLSETRRVEKNRFVLI